VGQAYELPTGLYGSSSSSCQTRRRVRAERFFRVAFWYAPRTRYRLSSARCTNWRDWVFEKAKIWFVEERAGDSSQRADFASKMVAWRPDAIVPIGGEAIHAARQATSTVPIVVSARPAPSNPLTLLHETGGPAT